MKMLKYGLLKYRLENYKDNTCGVRNFTTFKYENSLVFCLFLCVGEFVHWQRNFYKLSPVWFWEPRLYSWKVDMYGL